MVERDHIIKITSAGILAPSGDNNQPWKIYFDGEALHLVNLPEKDTSLYNTDNIASFISFGAMIENMTLVARSLGYDPSVLLFPKGKGMPLVATINFMRGQTVHDSLLPFISERCVNRKAYKARKLDLPVKDLLLGSTSTFEGSKLSLIEDEKEKIRLSRLLSLNDRLVFENRNLHDFLFEHLRWTKKQSETRRDGMSIASLELGWLQSQVMKILSSWRLVRFLNIFGFSRFVHLQSYQLCKGSSALCFLFQEGTDFDSYVHGGRALQRIWLTATSSGLSVHPMTGITFLFSRVQRGAKGLSTAHQKLLLNIYQEMKKLLAPLDETTSIIMAFRIGYADPPSDRALRLPLNQILIHNHPPF